MGTTKSRPRDRNRPRKHIRADERVAAALSMLLPADQRDAMRANRVQARAVLRLFHFDHVQLHALGGADSWWNLTPLQVGVHMVKSARDTSIVAKVDRIIAREGGHREAMDRLLKPTKRTTGHPGRVARPFPGGRASGWRRKVDGTVERR